MRMNSYIKSLYDDYEFNDGSVSKEDNELIICPYCGETHEPSEFIGKHLLVIGSDVINDSSFRLIEEGYCKRCSAQFDTEIEIKYKTTRIVCAPKLKKA